MASYTADDLKVVVRSEFDKAIKDYKKLGKGVEDATKSFDKQLASAKKIGTGLTRYLTLPLAAAGVAALKFAIDAEETHSKFSTAFKGIEVQAAATAASLHKNFGLATATAEQLLSTTGDLLKGFGASAAGALDLSDQVQRLAVDLASYSNIQGGASRASEILTKAMLGERDALTTLGIKISEEDVQGRLLEKGKKALTGQALLLAKAQATLELAVGQSRDAIGDYARTSDSAANQLRKLGEDTKELAAKFGKDLLPIAKDVLEVASGLVEKFTDLSEGARKTIFALSGIGLLAGPLIRVTTATIGLGRAIAKLDTMKLLRFISNPVVAGIAVGTIVLAAGAALDKAYTNRLNTDTAFQRKEIITDIQMQNKSLAQLHLISTQYGVAFDYVVRIAREEGLLTEEVDRQYQIQRQQLLNRREYLQLDEYLRTHQDEEGAGGATGNPPDSGIAKTAWRKWWADVTGSLVEDGTSTGGELADAFADGIDRALKNRQDIASTLGGVFDPEEFLRQKIEGIKSIITELLDIDPGAIDDPFSLANSSIDGLLDKLRELQVKLDAIQANKDIAKRKDLEWLDALEGIEKKTYRISTNTAAIAENVDKWPELTSFVADLTDVGNMARGLAGAFADVGRSIADGASASDVAEQAFKKFISSLSGEIAIMAIAAGLKAILVGNLPLGIALLAIGGIVGLSGGVAGSSGAGGSAGGIDYAAGILDAEKTLEDQRIDLLQETIDKENELRRENLRKLDREFNTEFAVLKDLWERNLVTTEEFKNQAADLGAKYDAGKTAIDAPSAAEKEKAGIQDSAAAAAAELATARANKLLTLNDQGVAAQKVLDSLKWWQPVKISHARADIEMINAKIAYVTNAKSIEEIARARYGADFETSGRQLLMVGDNPGGRERVSVEPISSPNRFGPRGSGDTLVIQGNTFVGVGGVDELIRLIEERKRSLGRRGMLN